MVFAVATSDLDPKGLARVLPHEYGNLCRLEPRQKIAVQVRVATELTSARFPYVIPTGILGY